MNHRSSKITEQIYRSLPPQWISVKDQLPQIGQVVKCKVNVWRCYVMHHTTEIEAKYIGMNEAINQPMFDYDNGDESYFEITHWMIPDPPKEEQ
jgi:hypothetical protein